jgi:hypothetical protein
MLLSLLEFAHTSTNINVYDLLPISVHTRLCDMSHVVRLGIVLTISEDDM